MIIIIIIQYGIKVYEMLNKNLSIFYLFGSMYKFNKYFYGQNIYSFNTLYFF